MTPIQLTLIVAAVAAALSGGITFAFSNFIMGALGRLAPADATRAMQHINEVVLNPLFLLVFIGTGLAMTAVSVVHVVSDNPVNGWLLAASALYLVGVVGVTVRGNVPLNEALAAVDANSADWHAFAAPWTRWNHVRTVAAVLASAAFFFAAVA